MKTNFSVGTAIESIPSLNVSVRGQKSPALRQEKRKSPMTSALDPTEINRVKVYPVKCLKCKLTVMARTVDKVCPVCGTILAKKQTSKGAF